MNSKYFYIFILLLLFGCKENQDITLYNESHSFVYFAVPNPDTRLSKKQLYIDSLDFSFVREDEEIKEKVVAIPINIIGQTSDRERSYSYTVDKNKSTVDMSWIDISEPVIRANKSQDTLFLTIQKDVAMENGLYYLVLNLTDSEDFQVGHEYNRNFQISITNQLLEPEWWNRWERYFGPYRREIYRLWMDIYYLGADPTPQDDLDAEPYYWDNMPYSAIESWYPVTFMYIDKLKKYLENTPVYPEGDTTQPRLYLP